jgi:nucleoside-diphosphate-sugar epimerase
MCEERIYAIVSHRLWFNNHGMHHLQEYSMEQTVLILGARGRFGLAAAKAFADAGWRVVAQRRMGGQVPQEAQHDPRIQWLEVDLFDTAALAQAARQMSAPAGVAVVVHALNPAYTNAAWKAQVLPMTEAALALCRTLKATLMLPGNIYNFGTDMPTVLSEDTPQKARTTKGQIRIAMEEHIRRSGVRSVVIRAGDFFGSGKGTWFDQAIVKDIAKGVFTYPGGLDVATAWAYLPDLARSFVAVAERRAQLKGFAVLHFAGHSITARQWLEALTPLAQAQGWVRQGDSVRYKRLPWALIRLGGLVVPTWASLAEMRYLWDVPHRLDNTRLMALLGAEPHTPLQAAVSTALQDLGHLGNQADQVDPAAYLAGTKPVAL